MFLTSFYVCRDKIMFVATNIILSRQKFCCGKQVFYHDKTFVATKMALVAAPTNDKRLLATIHEKQSIILYSHSQRC